VKILFAASEAFPFIKTGGLGDVVHSLSRALLALGDDVRLVLPAYRTVLSEVNFEDELACWKLQGADRIHDVRVLQVQIEGRDDPLYLIDVPALFDRPGNPYVDADGNNWPDNAERYTVFSRAVAQLAAGVPGSGWQPDVVHSHDWQAGLVPAFLSLNDVQPRTVFTIHNMAYDGHFSLDDFKRLGLPAEWWSPDYAEFYGDLSMLKAGLVFSDQVTTVSPTYAREICTPAFGYDYAGVLQHLGDRLSGILNGIDEDVWNPRTDSYIKQNYSLNYRRVIGKQANKQDLLARAGLPGNDAPLLGFIGRLVEQKGVDFLIAVLPRILNETDAQVVVLGSGEHRFETALMELANAYPQRLYVNIGYSEELAHRIEAGSDLYIMPSRFEPCGLNQMYSLHYGTPPVVNYTGGLADTVVDTTLESLNDNTANGFVMRSLNDEALFAAIRRGLAIFNKPKLWQQICRNAMSQGLGWESSARQYRKLYQGK